MRTRTAIGSEKSPLKMLWQWLQQGAVQQKQHDFSVWSRCVVAAALCLFAAMPSFATTYTYTSPNYPAAGITSHGTPVYTTAMNVTGSFTTASPLPANMPFTNIGPTGSNLIQTWTISDGLHTYTPSNASLTSSIAASTDAAGNILAFVIQAFSPPPPNVVGQKINAVIIAFPQFFEALSDGPCTVVDVNGRCTTIDSNTAGSDAGGGGGAFATSAPVAPTFTAAPNPAPQGQTVVLTANTGSSTATGTVTFSDGATVLCNAVAMVNGVATCGTSTLSLGTHTITATFTITTPNITVPPPFSLAALVTITAIPPPSAGVPAPALGTFALVLMALTMLLALALRRKNI